MDSYWFNKLLDLLMVQSNSENEKLMVLYLDRELGKLKLPYTIDAAGNVLVTKGKAETYPCVTAHMDTVHDFVDNLKIYTNKDDKDLLFTMDGKKRVGIGGDDKCGVFACLYLLKIIPEIKVVFFSREENGCKGSTAIDKRFFADCRYLIQLDRRGKRDFIQTYWGSKTTSHNFRSDIGLIKKEYKYKNCIGTVTDVMKLWNNKVGISCINLSCGYYEPHTRNEFISISDLWNSVKFTEAIIKHMKPKRYPSLPPPPTIVKTTTFYNNTMMKNLQGSSTPKYLQCDKCKTWKKETLLYEIKGTKPLKLWCYYCKYPQKNTTSNSPKPDINSKVQKAIVEQSILPDGKIVLFACFECGLTTSQMEKGDSLKYAGDGNMYCTTCMSVLFASNEKPKECFVCNRPIPKDHKIIERFGVRVCEDCACPSDLVLTKAMIKERHISELEQEN